MSVVTLRSRRLVVSLSVTVRTEEDTPLYLCGDLFARPLFNN